MKRTMGKRTKRQRTKRKMTMGKRTKAKRTTGGGQMEKGRGGIRVGFVEQEVFQF